MATSSQFDPKFLPNTAARIPASIKLFILDGSGKSYQIGAAKGMRVRMRRSTHARYQLDSDYPGSIEEIIPGKMEEISLTLSRVMLYNNKKSGANDVFGKGDWQKGFQEANLMYSNVGLDIILQHKPFIVKEQRLAPPDTEKETTPKTDETILYKGCYVVEIPYDYRIDGDWIIVQEMEVVAASAEYETS